MATATEPKTADTAGYVDFDEFIDFQISKTRSGIKATDLLTAVIGGAAAVLGYVLVFALFDHWIIDGGFSTGVRIALLSVLAAGLLGWSIWKLVLPYFRHVTPLFAARQIEQTQPDLQNTLLTLVDLKRIGRPVPESIETALEKRSALNLSHMDVDQAVDRRLLMRLSYLLFFLVVLTCAYVLLSPKKLSNSLWRALLPTSSVSVATRTRIDHVEPGDVEVLARSQLTVTADISGETPDDVTLLFSTQDRRFVDEPVTMRQTDEALRRYSGIITGENGAGILQNLTYRVVAGDARSREYVVTVKQPPSATVQSVQYEFPDYMGLDDRTQQGGAIDSYEGTWVTVSAKANMPVESALIKFSDTEDITQRAEEIPAEVHDGVTISARWQLRIRSDGTYPSFYRVECRNEAGDTDLDPTLYSIRITPDLAPRIELVQPTGDLARPANAIVPLLYAAEDPDFLLRSVVLHFEVNGDSLPEQPRLFQAPPYRKSVHDVHHLELAELDLRPGDRLAYWLEARDNMEPFADRSGNRSNTPKLNITIAEPASPEEVQQQLEDDQEQIARKLEEAAEQPDDLPADPRRDDREPPTQNNEPDPGSSDEPQQAADTDANEEQNQSGGGPGGESTEEGGGQAGPTQSQPSQQQGSGDAAADQAAGESSSQQGDEPGPDGSEESFDDLLKKLIQREQNRQQQQADQQQDPGEGDPQTQPSEKQESGATDRQDPADSQQAAPGPESGQRAAEGGENSGAESDAPPGDRQGATPPSDPGAPNTPASGSDAQQSGEASGTKMESPADNQGETQPEERQGSGGEPVSQESASDAGEAKPSGEDASGGQKQPGDDPSGGQPGDGKTNEQTKPKRGEAPEPVGDPSERQPGDPTDNPESKSGGQPDGPDEPLKGEGNPEGQRSDRPQTGEAGNSQQTTQGNRGGDQKGPGDSTGQPGSQEAASESTGQAGDSPGSASPGKSGSESTSRPDAETSPDPDSSQDTGQRGAPQPDTSQKGSPEPETSESGDGRSEDTLNREEQSGSSPKGTETESGQGDAPSDAESGTQPPGGETGSQPGQSGEQPGGQAGQPGEGDAASEAAGQPTAPPSGGSPGESGSGTQSDGGAMDRTDPDGPGIGGEGVADPGDATSGDGTPPSLQQEEADLEAKKKAANLVLERLEDQLQRGEIDPELQEELNVTPEQLREFTQKLQERLAETSGDDSSPDAQARRRQFEEMLRTIDFGSTGTTREGGDGPRQAAGGFAGPNRPAPPEYRDAARLYRERLMKRRSNSR